MNTRSYVLVLVVILAAVYAAAGAYFASQSASYDARYGFPVLNGGDSHRYALLAEHLVEKSAYTPSETEPYEPEIARGPGYSFFLMPFVLLFDSFMPVAAAQVLMVIESALLVYDMGRKLFSEKTGFIAALVFSLNPAIMFYSFTVLTDIFFLFLFLLGTYLLFFKSSAARYPWVVIIAGSILLGYATLVRPAGIYAIAIILFFLMLACTHRFGWKKAGALAMLSGVAYISVLLPWYARNYREAGALTLSTVGPYTLLFYNAAGYLAEKEGVPADEVKERLRLRHFPEEDPAALYGGAYAKQIQSLAGEYIAADPLRYAWYHAKGSINFFLASSLRDVSNEVAGVRERLRSAGLLNDSVSLRAELASRGLVGGTAFIFAAEPLFVLERGVWLLIALLAVASPFVFLRDRRLPLILFFAAIVAYFALIYGPVSYPRYRIAAEPFLILLAAGSAYALSTRLRGLARRSFSFQDNDISRREQ